MTDQTGRGDLVKRSGTPNAQRTAASAAQRKLTDKQAKTLQRLLNSTLIVSSQDPRYASGAHVHPGVSNSLEKLGLAHRVHWQEPGRLHQYPTVAITTKGIAAIRAHTGKSWLGMNPAALQDHALQLKRVLHDARQDSNQEVIKHITDQLHGIGQDAYATNTAIRLRRKEYLQAAVEKKAEYEQLRAKPTATHGRERQLKALGSAILASRGNFLMEDAWLRERHGRPREHKDWMFSNDLIERAAKRLATKPQETP